jgi:hypothetical protein
MSVTEPGPMGSAPLVARVQGILLHPGPEWDKIDTEPATTQGLYIGYVCILAAIGPVAGAVGSLAFGHSFLGITYRPPIAAVLIGAVVSYLLALASVFILGLVIDALAPSFDGHKNQTQALKIAAYSGTAGWLAGVFGIIPSLAPLAALGALYNLYLLYIGMPKLMKAPQEKALGYTVVTILVSLVLFLVVGVIGGAVIGAAGGLGHMGAGGISSTDGGTLSGNLHLGGASVDLGKLQAASKQMEAAASSMQAQQNGQPGTVKAVPADTLKALLPATLLSGFARTEVEASSAGAGGVSGSNAHGVYARGDQKITLEVTDMAALGALAALGGAVNAQSDRETATGYEKMGAVNGRMTNEEFDRQTKVGKFSVVVANRFMVEANGEGVEMGDLKAAVSSVGFDRLEGLSRG